MPQPDYAVFEIQPEWVLEPEALGSKEKFWYRAKDDEPEWLFKFPQANTGQHWAEKIAAEVAERLNVPHALVELAVFQDVRGSATETFAQPRQSLYHGNQILAGLVGYDPAKAFHQSDHTLSNIFAGIDKAFDKPENAHEVKNALANYFTLDALIGNTDRHHENWGLLIWEDGNEWQGIHAPSFDHASSLGRELRDTGEGKSRERLLNEGRVGEYSEKGHGAIYWETADRRGLSPLELVRRATKSYPELFWAPLIRLKQLNPDDIMTIISRVPAGWMTPLARQFAIELMRYNMSELGKIAL